MPPGCHGWQRANRRAASHNPRPAPYFNTASLAYTEQLGWNLQAGARSGL